MYNVYVPYIQIAPTTLQRLVVSVWTCTAFPLQNNGVLLVWNPLIVETNNYYYTFNSLSIISLAKSLQLILEISATYMYRLVSYLLADNWLICRLHAQCIISNLEQCQNLIGSMQQHYRNAPIQKRRSWKCK